MSKPKTSNKEKFETLKKQIVGNSKDAQWMEKQIQELLSLHKKMLHEPVEIEVPCKEVKETLDFGACRISRTIRGYLFEAKGGLFTFVDLRMQSICTMIQTLFDLHNKEDKTEDDNIVYENFQTAIEYCFQAPIFASLEETSLFEIATAILKTFNDYAVENYVNAEAVDETAQDVRDNIESENMARGLEALANTPLPPED